MQEVPDLVGRAPFGLLTETGETAVTTPTLWMRSATLDDVDTLLDWRVKTAAQLRERYGTDQWSVPYPRWKLEQWVRRGSMWMALPAPNEDAPAIATLTLDPEPEPGTDFWTEEERQVSAWYLSKLNRNPAAGLAGQGIGRTLLEWAQTQASLAGIGEIRFDVWTTNSGLRAWYEELGSKFVRVVPGVPSGACYRLPTRVFETPVLMLPGPRQPSEPLGDSEAGQPV
jgi:ribosomal protein S18 acetylase RimI-like enzyme